MSIFLNFNIYLKNIYIYMYIKHILRVLIPGVTVSVSDSRIFVSRVPVSGDLGTMYSVCKIDHSRENYSEASCPSLHGLFSNKNTYAKSFSFSNYLFKFIKTTRSLCIPFLYLITKLNCYKYLGRLLFCNLD